MLFQITSISTPINARAYWYPLNERILLRNSDQKMSDTDESKIRSKKGIIDTIAPISLPMRARN